MSEYKLLDSGFFRKLELVNQYKIIRPCPQAVWQPKLDKGEWANSVDDIYIRNSKGGGSWKYKNLKDKWVTTVGEYQFLTKPTQFGHLGFFAEQIENWQWLTDICQKNNGIKTMNLFAYTGGSSIAMQKGGASVVHVDAAKGIIDWAKQTANINNINNIRWIVDDVHKFVDREIRRNNFYDGIVLDPPSYGRGPNGEVWQIEKDLFSLMTKLTKLLSDKAKFILLSCHSSNFTPKALQNLMFGFFGNKVTMESGEMFIPEHLSNRVIPSGSYIKVIFG